MDLECVNFDKPVVISTHYVTCRFLKQIIISIYLTFMVRAYHFKSDENCILCLLEMIDFNTNSSVWMIQSHCNIDYVGKWRKIDLNLPSYGFAPKFVLIWREKIIWKCAWITALHFYLRISNLCGIILQILKPHGSERRE